MAVLPLMTSSTRHASNNSGPFATTAFAGHSNANGYWCNGEPGADGVCSSCGASVGLNRAMVNQDGEDSAVQDPPLITSQPDSDSDGGAVALLLLVALMAWSRM